LKVYQQKRFRGLVQIEDVPNYDFKPGHCFIEGECSFEKRKNNKILLTYPDPECTSALLYLPYLRDRLTGADTDYSITVFWGDVENFLINRKEGLLHMKADSFLLVESLSWHKNEEDLEEYSSISKTISFFYFYLTYDLEMKSFSIPEVHDFLIEYRDKDEILSILEKDEDVLLYFAQRYKESLGEGYEYLEELDSVLVKMAKKNVEQVKCENEKIGKGKLSLFGLDGAISPSTHIDDSEITLYSPNRLPAYIGQAACTLFGVTSILTGNIALAGISLAALAFITIKYPWQEQITKKRIVEKEVLPLENNDIDDVVKEEMEEFS